MAGFEAANTIQPQRNVKHTEFIRKSAKGYLWAVVILFILVGFLCANHYMLLNSYREIKGELSDAYKIVSAERNTAQKIAKEVNELQEKYKMLIEENSKLKESFSKASRGSDEIDKQLNTLKKQNSDLSKRNSELAKQTTDLAKQLKDLANDNVALQNSLKMAAAVGVKPQNYSAFEGLEPRDGISRGKYVGEFLGTAYTPSKEECGNDKGITKSGEPVMPGVSIAIDNRYWPFGTIFYIKGLGYTIAMDTGSAIKGKYRFDFSVFDKQFARQLGSRKWEVYLVKLGTGNVKNIKL